MKNLSVRKKILLGFSVTIAFLVVIILVVFFSNMRTASDLATEQSENALLGLNDEYVLHYWRARVEAAPLYTSLDVNAHDNTIHYIDLALETLGRMDSRIVDYPVLQKYRGDISTIKKDLTDWKIAIDQVESSNRALEKAIDGSRGRQEELRLAADATYQNQQSIWQEETQGDFSPADRLRRAGRLDETVVFMRVIEEIVSTGEYMYSTRDVSNKGAFLERMDNLAADLQENGDVARYQGTKDTAYFTIEVLNRYREAFEDFERANALSFEDIAKARQLGELTTDEVAALSDKLDASSHQAINYTVVNNRSSLILTVFIAAFSILAALIVAFFISGMIAKPIIPLADFMQKAGTTGDIAFSQADADLIQNYSKNNDEIGRCIAGAVAFIGHVTNIANELEIIAGGNLTTVVEPLSGADKMGQSLKHMTDSLNQLFTEINISTGQVSVGAKQIANGAQNLANGSSVQASSISDLSISIAAIAQKTKANADTAEKAAGLASEIIGIAEKGSRQMDDMMAAVHEINRASQDISKVIKVIDDIAFQTNILALNAAVEAARAGEHGKGFSVVAEEVRDLASKSAEAARETGSMIENSIKKANLGTHIAGETSASLMEIVSGINESSLLVQEIAKASEDQASGIVQINSGIDQVAQVVQQNSATAEESAAASQEMSAQSSLLQGLIARLKLK